MGPVYFKANSGQTGISVTGGGALGYGDLVANGNFMAGSSFMAVDGTSSVGAGGFVISLHAEVDGGTATRFSVPAGGIIQVTGFVTGSGNNFVDSNAGTLNFDGEDDGKWRFETALPQLLNNNCFNFLSPAGALDSCIKEGPGGSLSYTSGTGGGHYFIDKASGENIAAFDFANNGPYFSHGSGILWTLDLTSVSTSRNVKAPDTDGALSVIASNCTSANGTCGSAISGAVSIAASLTSMPISTTAVTANSDILITENSALGPRLGITCNVTTGRTYSISSITPGSGFVITTNAAPNTNPACLSFLIVN